MLVDLKEALIILLMEYGNLDKLMQIISIEKKDEINYNPN